MQPRYYAELCRVTTLEVPSTETLPADIMLQQPDDSVEDTVTIGRHRANNVNLDCTRVCALLSRCHASIKPEPDGVHTVTDNDTVNGTYLNGNLIPSGPCPLQHGDVVAFGGPANVSRRFTSPLNDFTAPQKTNRHSRLSASFLPQILRDSRSLRNPFRFEYRRPLTLEQWRSAMAESGAPGGGTERRGRGRGDGGGAGAGGRYGGAAACSQAVAARG